MRARTRNALPRGASGPTGTAAHAGGGLGVCTSVQLRPLQETVAVARRDADLEGVALAMERQRHRDAGVAERPDPAEEAGEARDPRPADREHEVAGAQAGAAGRAVAGKAHDHDLVLDVGREEAEPGPGRAVR